MNVIIKRDYNSDVEFVRFDINSGVTGFISEYKRKYNSILSENSILVAAEVGITASMEDAAHIVELFKGIRYVPDTHRYSSISEVYWSGDDAKFILSNIPYVQKR